MYVLLFVLTTSCQFHDVKAVQSVSELVTRYHLDPSLHVEVSGCSRGSGASCRRGLPSSSPPGAERNTHLIVSAQINQTLNILWFWLWTVSQCERETLSSGESLHGVFIDESGSCELPPLFSDTCFTASNNPVDSHKATCQKLSAETAGSRSRI